MHAPHESKRTCCWPQLGQKRASRGTGWVQARQVQASAPAPGAAVEPVAPPIMPANIPHAVKAEERFKMILTMIRSKKA